LKKLSLHIRFAFILLLAVVGLKAQTPQDSIPTDSTAVLPYDFSAHQTGSLYLNDFENYEVVYDVVQNRYLVVTKIGDYEISYPIVMTPEEYSNYRLKKDMHDYYKGKLGAISGKKKGSEEDQKNLLPTYYINSNFFKNVFGSNEIEVNMQGNIEVKLGILHQEVDNPNLNESNRKPTIFDFNQNIGASIMAKVGERLRVSANYDTQSTFDFQDIVKLEFDPSAGYDDDGIIRKIEVGNISMPMRSTLIRGAQNLFGLRTELQFGKTTISAVYAKQQSQSKTVQAEGGSIIEEFQLQASDYEADRHFFLAQYFKDNFDKTLKNFPLVSSSIQITSIEVWTTNTNNTTNNVRNIVALADLGETHDPEGNSNIGNMEVTETIPLPFLIPDNSVNTLNSVLEEANPIRDISRVSESFSIIAPSNQQGRDYSVLENARRLVEGSDFILDRQLGYISLNRRLTESDVLAVAFEYTINGSSNVYKVGELSSDGIIAPANLVVKLLRSEIVITDVPLWELMMKNIYNLQAYQLNEEGFRLELLYENDATGVPINTLQAAQTSGVSALTLLNLFYIDRLDQNDFELDGGDGYFDFVEGTTIFANKGYMMFPKVEPFGEYIDGVLDSTDDQFVFNELYELTQDEVKNSYQQKDKYQIKGYYKSDSASGIALGAFNVPQGSVQVTSGGRELVEGVDYVVDYQIGRVKIINPSIEASNAPISVSVEQNAIFNQQRRSFFGVDVEHKVSDNFIVGASYLNLREKPFTNKVFFGSEPIQNSIFGLNTSFNTEADILTKWVNKLPFSKTDAVSNFSIRGDVAYLIPGTPKSIDINGEASSYIDDFEGSQTPLQIRSEQQWYLASTPKGDTTLDLGGDEVGLAYGMKRARLSWFNIDSDLYNTNRPENIDNDELSRAEVRRIDNEELFPEDEQDYTESSFIRTLNLAFFPNERGTYNFDTEPVTLNADGTFNNPEERWGGITRPLTITDFENSNIEYIQFWIMNPYENYSITEEEGLPQGIDPFNSANQTGELYINLGNISEDVLKDGRKTFENGLPEAGENDDNVYFSQWGKIPKNQALLNAFDDNDDNRLVQDVGFDGLSDENERTYNFNNEGVYPDVAAYLNALPAAARADAQADPFSDNFHFYKGSDFDNQDASIITRYKNYSRTEGNSPTANLSTESYPTASTQYPDTEDFNKDQTMSTVESYYKYKISLNQADLQVGSNYIVDKRETSTTLPNGNSQTTTWYQFRVPIASGEPIGGINNFHSIRFMRLVMTKFKMPVVLRFGEMELVRGEWRRYKFELDNGDEALMDLDNFESGVVNIEENNTRTPIPYVLPPGIVRERLQGTTTVQEQNEQSLSLKVRDLQSEDGRSLFKNVSFDVRMFKRLQMFIHAEAKPGNIVNDDELVAVIRIGSDLSDNFYQIEQPLKITAASTSTATGVWPEENELNVDLEALKKLKLERYETLGNLQNTILFPEPVIGEASAYRLRVKGHPNLGKIKTIMLGVKNKSSNPKTAEIWFNELRVSDFDNEGGWAAVVSTDANFADLMDVSVTGRMSTKGYGNVDQSVNERSQEDIKQYDAVSNLNAGKLLPNNWAIQLPISFSIGEEIKDPKYDAQYQDIVLEDTNADNSPHRNDAQDYTKRTSISLINVKKNRNPKSTKKQRFYDVENLSVSYAYNEVLHRDYNVEKFLDQNVRASAGYNYSFKPFEVTPFSKSKALKGKHFKLIKDFNINLLPNDISINSNIIRGYNEQLSRTLIGFSELPTLKQRNFLFDWDYSIGYKPTKSIRLNFRALNNNTYDDFDSNSDILLYQNFFNLGRPLHYHQTLDGSYQIPIDKIPLLSFIKSNYSYTADFDWQGSSKSYVNQIGNTIQNANTHNLSADFNMKKFYREIGLTKLLRNKKQKKRAKETREKQKRERQEKGNDVAGDTEKNEGKSEGGKNEKDGNGSNNDVNKALKGIYDLITAVQTVKVSYQENNGTLLPAYQPTTGLLGRNNFSGGFAPTFGFVFGSQVDIRNRALENGWLLTRDLSDPLDIYYNKIFNRTHYEKLDATAKVSPFKDFDIDVQANKIYTRNISEQIDPVVNNLGDAPYFNDAIPTETGNFSMSFLMLGTAFDDADALFQQFKENRYNISLRLLERANNSSLVLDGFGPTSQQVVLPAFLAAYSGQSVEKVALNPFRDIPLPNWQIRYRGLMKMKWFKKRFKSFSISHAYRSSYSILNYTNNLQYDPNDIGKINPLSGNYYNEKLFTNVGLIEEFSPLVKVDFKLKNSFSIEGRINSDRMMTLNLNNNTMTQNNGTEYVVGLGYRLKDLPFTMRLKGKKMKFKGDLDMKLDVSLRDDKMMVRYFGEDDSENDQITGGQNTFNLRFVADYALTKNLQAGFYYIQDASAYQVSTTYDRRSISSGISFKYNLGN